MGAWEPRELLPTSPMDPLPYALLALSPTDPSWPWTPGLGHPTSLRLYSPGSHSGSCVTLKYFSALEEEVVQYHFMWTLGGLREVISRKCWAVAQAHQKT